MTLRSIARALIPRPLRTLRRRLVNLGEEGPLYRFVLNPPAGLSRRKALTIAKRFLAAHEGIDCAHTHREMDRIVRAIWALPSSDAGDIVEAGCFKGASTAKLSIAAKLTGRKLFVFDSFEGLPENMETHGLTMHGETPDFSRGRYSGELKEVQENVRRFGDIDTCEFIKGWFDQTMPAFNRKVAVAFIDVDLQSSTKTCLQYLYPLLVQGGSIFSHDGHLPLCMDVMRDESFWTHAIGYPKPPIPDLGITKLVRIEKSAPSSVARTG